jgi:hypothetical protein
MKHAIDNPIDEGVEAWLQRSLASSCARQLQYLCHAANVGKKCNSVKNEFSMRYHARSAILFRMITPCVYNTVYLTDYSTLKHYLTKPSLGLQLLSPVPRHALPAHIHHSRPRPILFADRHQLARHPPHCRNLALLILIKHVLRALDLHPP